LNDVSSANLSFGKNTFLDQLTLQASSVTLSEDRARHYGAPCFLAKLWIFGTSAQHQGVQKRCARLEGVARGDWEMWVLLIIALASPGAADGGVHSSITTLQFQTQVSCENAAKIVNQMTIRSAASSLAVTSSCVQQK
jgi:hypothetical protein